VYALGGRFLDGNFEDETDFRFVQKQPAEGRWKQGELA
jgi:hypothetical protein